MAEPEKTLRKLIEHPLRMPAYLAPVDEKLRDLSEAISESLAEYLNCTVASKGYTVARAHSSNADVEGADYYDTMIVDGAASLRIHLSKEDLTTLTSTLFQGPVEEPMLQVKVAEAVVKRFAEAISMKALSLGAGTSVVKAVQAPLSEKPTLSARYTFEIGDEENANPPASPATTL
ncbi:MAG: hypothetical protein AAF986_00780, partial [Pseudomonadota bacterium]